MLGPGGQRQEPLDVLRVRAILFEVVFVEIQGLVGLTGLLIPGPHADAPSVHAASSLSDSFRNASTSLERRAQSSWSSQTTACQ